MVAEMPGSVMSPRNGGYYKLLRALTEIEALTTSNTQTEQNFDQELSRAISELRAKLHILTIQGKHIPNYRDWAQRLEPVLVHLRKLDFDASTMQRLLSTLESIGAEADTLNRGTK